MLKKDSSKYSSSDYESDDLEEEIEKYDELYGKEDEDLRFFGNLATHMIDGLKMVVFNSGDLASLKGKDRILLEKEEKKYFRSKITDKDPYKQITNVITPYLADENFKILSRPWSTQNIEPMNNPVAAYAPKKQNSSGMMSIKTKVGVAAGVLSLDHLGFWTRIFQYLDLQMDDKFAATLVTRNKKKEKKNRRHKSKNGKIKRRKGYNKKLDQAHVEQMHDAKRAKRMARGLHCQQQRKKRKPHSPLHHVILKEYRRTNCVVCIIILFVTSFLDTAVVHQNSVVLIQKPKLK